MNNLDEQRIREIVREEIANAIPKRRSKNNGEKKPNKWHIFLKDCTKKQPEEFSYGDKVKACSMEYKTFKGKGILESNNGQTNPQVEPNSKPLNPENIKNQNQDQNQDKNQKEASI